MSFTVYYASDIHGADRLWRKFINAGKFYDADVLVMGGDITGKAVVPIIRANGSLRVPELIGDRVAPAEELESLETQIRNRGFYPYVTTEDELAATHGDPQAVTDLFGRAMAQSVRAWLTLAEERLAGTGIRLFMMLGNDDEPALQEVLAESPLHVDCEDETVELAESIQMSRAGSPTRRRGTPRARCPRRSWPCTSRGWWPSSRTRSAASSTSTCRPRARRLTRRPSSTPRSSRWCAAAAVSMTRPARRRSAT